MAVEAGRVFAAQVDSVAGKVSVADTEGKAGIRRDVWVDLD